jgi:hypothetical protein
VTKQLLHHDSEYRNNRIRYLGLWLSLLLLSIEVSVALVAAYPKFPAYFGNPSWPVILAPLRVTGGIIQEYPLLVYLTFVEVYFKSISTDHSKNSPDPACFRKHAVKHFLRIPRRKVPSLGFTPFIVLAKSLLATILQFLWLWGCHWRCWTGILAVDALFWR